MDCKHIFNQPIFCNSIVSPIHIFLWAIVHGQTRWPIYGLKDTNYGPNKKTWQWWIDVRPARRLYEQKSPILDFVSGFFFTPFQLSVAGEIGNSITLSIVCNRYKMLIDLRDVILQETIWIYANDALLMKFKFINLSTRLLRI